MTGRTTVSRRRVLGHGAAGVLCSQLPGCCLVKPPEAICPFDPRYTDRNSLLTIDVHTHLFNASDLQVKAFIERVAVRDAGGLGNLVRFFGGVLQGLGWSVAPTVSEERAQLARLRPAIKACDTEQNLLALGGLQQQQYEVARSQLLARSAARASELRLSSSDLAGPLTALPAEAQGLKLIRELPERYADFVQTQQDMLSATAANAIQRVTISSALAFVIEMFQYRFVSAYNYLETYQGAEQLKIDLLAPALVDYDFWLAKGNRTPSELPEQAALMGEIAELTGGRVHMLVPFDPYRQVVFDAGGPARFSPLALVEQAITTQGAIGVKLYPPMGFAPKGNARLDVWRDKDWLKASAHDPRFPQQLDDALARLYDYCADNDVPIMGHSNRSNGAADDFEGLTAPRYWSQAINDHPGVTMSFGHFGGTGGASSTEDGDIIEFLKLLNRDAAQARPRIHADASYFSNLLDAPDTLTAVLEAIYRYDPRHPEALVHRLMYGSDWKMLTVEKNADRYLSGFDAVIRRVEDQLGSASNLRARFFGHNAASFLGLERGQANRDRLETFYDANDMPQPVWMGKVDDQMTARSR